MGTKEQIFGDLMLSFGLVKVKKGESIFGSMRRYGKKVRKERSRAFRKAVKRGSF